MIENIIKNLDEFFKIAMQYANDMYFLEDADDNWNCYDGEELCVVELTKDSVAIKA